MHSQRCASSYWYQKSVYEHTESSPRRLKEDEQDLLNCISEFECFPFDPAVPTLRTLQSAIPASDKLIADLKSVYVNGKAKLMKFLEERVFIKFKKFFDSVATNKRLTFAGEGGTGCNYRNSRKKCTRELK